MTSSERRYDLISLGEPLLRLSPPGREPLRRAALLDLRVAGSQMNVAANLARLGWATALLTRLPDHSLGWLVADYCRACGIDTGCIQFVAGAKMGLTWVEFSALPRPPLAVYDRAGSAASTITADTFPWDELVGQSRFAYTDGIFPGLSPSCREAAFAYLSAAKRAGCMVCFDVNFREHLWTAEQARQAWSELLPFVDLLITNPGVSEAVFGYRGSDEEIMARYAAEFGCGVVCLTRREDLEVNRGAFNGRAWQQGTVFEGRRQEFEIVDRYGTGDAWTAGFIYGYAEGGPQYGLSFANAALALAHTVPGDVLHATPAEIEQVMEGATARHARR